MAPPATNEEDTVTRPIYPDRPSQLPSFTVQLGEWLPYEDTNYASLLKQHTVMYRDRTCVVNATHARQLITDTFPTDKGFTDPASGNIAFDSSLVPRPAPSPPASAPAPAEDASGGSSTRTPVPTTPNTPPDASNK